MGNLVAAHVLKSQDNTVNTIYSSKGNTKSRKVCCLQYNPIINCLFSGGYLPPSAEQKLPKHSHAIPSKHWLACCMKALQVTVWSQTPALYMYTASRAALVRCKQQLQRLPFPEDEECPRMLASLEQTKAIDYK